MLGCGKGRSNEVVLRIYSIVKFDKSFNVIFIVLIPKNIRGLKVKDYKPINLVNRMYKIISKVLTTRLGKVLGMIIKKLQNAFVRGK